MSKSYLDELVELALKNNTDLAKAAINVNKALAQAGVLQANLIQSDFFSKKLIRRSYAYKI